MSLSAREQHVLDSIKDDLTDSDPKLAGLMATFTRLVSGEEMPFREGVWSGSRRAGRRPGRTRTTVTPGALLLLWLLISVVLVAIALILSQSGSGNASGCTQSWPAVCATSQPSAPTQHLIPGG
jgi:hypothetical protein